MYQYTENITGAEPISLEEAKAFMRVIHTSDDTQITSIIKRVRQTAEQYLSRSFIEKEIVLYIEESSNNQIKLPFPHHNTVTSVLINGVESLSSTTIKGLTQLTVIGSFVGKEVKITYNTKAVFEDGIKSAMLKEILNQYQNKDSYYMENPALAIDRFKGMLKPFIKMSF